jgi:hypothetical protein
MLRNDRSRRQKSVATMRTELLRFNGAIERDPPLMRGGKSTQVDWEPSRISGLR